MLVIGTGAQMQIVMLLCRPMMAMSSGTALPRFRQVCASMAARRSWMQKTAVRGGSVAIHLSRVS